MKKDIHPIRNDVTARCACGNEFQTRSTARELKVTLCSNCHAYYTGSEKLMDTAGRIEKFRKKFDKKA
jgi:large subunit ribosomal protein L31